MWNVITTGLTFVRNFKAASIVLAALGAVAGAALAGVGAWLWRSGQVAELREQNAGLRVELAELRADNATETARRMQVAAAEITENLAQLRAQSEAMLAELTAAGSRIIAAGRDLAARQKQLSEDERYACRREPLPADYLDRLRLPAE